MTNQNKIHAERVANERLFKAMRKVSQRAKSKHEDSAYTELMGQVEEVLYGKRIWFKENE